jgi:aldose 1-epimerase
MENSFRWETEKDENYGLKIISLLYKEQDNPSHNLEIKISPTIGCSMCEFKVGSDSVIKYNPNVINKQRFFGNPILYPTPNRVRGCAFDLNGIRYKQAKYGKERLSHGLVYDEEWQYDLPLIQEDFVIFKTWIDFFENNPMFEAFPFKHRLTVDFKLEKTGIMVIYSVDNWDVKDLPFGFALHPFFEKLSGENGTLITIPTDYVMESTPDCLPTGRVLEVENTPFDIRTPSAVGGLNVDHNYIGLKSNIPSSISYENKPFYLTLDTSDEFTHIVLFTPPKENFFCIENQTCSTDAHNLYNKGFKEESGLIFVSPGHVHQGYIKYSVHFK